VEEVTLLGGTWYEIQIVPTVLRALDHSSDKFSFNFPSKPIPTFSHYDLKVICSGQITLSKEGKQIANASGDCKGQVNFRGLRRNL